MQQYLYITIWSEVHYNSCMREIRKDPVIVCVTVTIPVSASKVALAVRALLQLSICSSQQLPVVIAAAASHQ